MNLDQLILLKRIFKFKKIYLTQWGAGAVIICCGKDSCFGDPLLLIDDGDADAANILDLIICSKRKIQTHFCPVCAPKMENEFLQ